jgi:hypothetical protein
LKVIATATIKLTTAKLPKLRVRLAASMDHSKIMSKRNNISHRIPGAFGATGNPCSCRMTASEIAIGMQMKAHKNPIFAARRLFQE